MYLFASTVFISAFLLFQIQPIIAKMILPWFGGSSSVWSTCIVFFQAELLLGYAYVHWLHQKFTPKRQAVIHALLLVLSLLMLPVAADPSWKGTALSHPSWSVLVVLAAAVGVPYLLLSTTGPLMQAWYAKTLPANPDANKHHPFRLYALSNVASMLALLSYPVLVEPRWSVGTQAMAWSFVYALFVTSCVATAIWAWKHMKSVPEVNITHSGNITKSPGWRECLVWIGLAATPSILLLALTTLLTQDVAPIPFLWVMPLSIYLLSFILCFDAPRYYVRKFYLAVLPLAFLGIELVQQDFFDTPVMIATLCLSLFVFCMVCHGELVRRKPDISHLTLFYLMLSVGGALGGTLVGLVAPSVFPAYFELPLGLFLCAALVVMVLWRELSTIWRWALLTTLAAYSYWLILGAIDFVDGYRRVTRNFYSQLRVQDVQEPETGLRRFLRHGRINHGEQYMSESLRRKPTAYFCEQSGIGLAFLNLLPQEPRKIGILGLGIGTLAVYGRAGDSIRMYEINEQVLDLAQSEFTYLKDSPSKIEHVLGDGRLMLEREQSNQFDLLTMDAFSGDSVPTHLITLEAMKVYFAQIKPTGYLALNITNTYLDMQPVMAAAAAHYGKVAMVYALQPKEGDAFCRRSVWAFIMDAKQADNLPDAMKEGVRLSPRPGFKPWTDNFSNLLGILK
jgi:hypothetical protein